MPTEQEIDLINSSIMNVLVKNILTRRCFKLNAVKKKTAIKSVVTNTYQVTEDSY